VCVYVCKYMRVYMHCRCVCMYVCIFVCMYVNVCKYTQKYTHGHFFFGSNSWDQLLSQGSHTYIHTYTLIPIRFFRQQHKCHANTQTAYIHSHARFHTYIHTYTLMHTMSSSASHLIDTHTHTHTHIHTHTMHTHNAHIHALFL
jgi:hypothetical protein